MKAGKPTRKKLKKLPGNVWREKASEPGTGNLRRARQEGDLDRLSDFFQQSRNPTAAWLFWSLAKRWDMPVPEPIAAEIDRFADAVAEMALAALDGDESIVINGDTVGTLWDTQARGQGSTPIAVELKLWDRDLQIGLRVFELRKITGTKDEAFEIAAEEFGISASSADHI
ncbi:MAG: hypothetical protein EON84_21290, partial [Bradyrhizobiaceae bacterium]